MLRLQRTSLLLLVALSVTNLTALAQTSDPPPRPLHKNNSDKNWYRPPSTMRGKTMLIPIGSTWEGRIDQTISSQHSHPGTKFAIVLSSPVLVNGSEVVIPSGSQIMGEVVEAIPASDVPRTPGQDKRLVHGRLRVQLTGLRTPDGVSYPLVAHLAGEQGDRFHRNQRGAPLGTSVGYTGSAGSFEAARPGHNSRPGQMKVMSRHDLLKDALLGTGDEGWQNDSSSTIRSLIKKKRDYYIMAGSPLTIRLGAPFKIGIAPPDMGVGVDAVDDSPDDVLPGPSQPSQQAAGNNRQDSSPGTPYAGKGNTAAGGGEIPADSF